MLIALLTDIHANREAFDACRAEARRLGADKFVYLGDLVGYGAEPGYIVDCVAQDVAQGALCVMGNHDLAAARGGSSSMNDYARAAIEWTSTQLDGAQKSFLAGLPMTATTRAESGDETLYVHSDASAPAKFRYVTGPEEAAASLDATSARVTFCGHVHRLQLYYAAPGRNPLPFRPTAHLPTPLARSRRWLGVLSSVGQPRDGNPQAGFALYDDARCQFTSIRVAYDIEKAAQKILAVGLPDYLAERLLFGH
jgi:diadenosine tetraphosphatase ApaH/serine/threonine PP2A family protein phosphatase